jgi:NADH dehydrogenase
MARFRALQFATGAAAGLLAGLISAGLLAALDGAPAFAGLGGTNQPGLALAIHLALSALMGAGYAWLFKPAGYAESLMSGSAYAVFWWALLPLSLLPVLMGSGPQWQAAAVAAAFPTLLGSLVQGGLTGLGYHILHGVAARRLGLPPAEEPTSVGSRGAPPQPQPAQVLPAVRRTSVVILGGGFAGVTTAQYLERLFGADESVSITLVSDTNHLLFTPMLSEVTAGGVEAQHIGPPLRAFFHRTRVVRGEVQTVDLAARIVRLASDPADPHAPPYAGTQPDLPVDHLVLALGAVPNFFGNKGIEANAFTFKSLGDAILLRNHVIEMLERADAEPDPQRRKALVTFVVAGGGFAGAELVGGLNDFVRGALWYYPNIPPEDVSLVLVHSGDRILPELSAGLGEYAREKMATRGVTFKLGRRLADAGPGRVTLSDGEAIPTETFVWTAGNMPHPLPRALGLEVDRRGSVVTDLTLAVPHAAGPVKV